ncbi:hypothetical protein TNCV_3714951 [Trichonephila clavipes]|nr:hypothetical protein TNCV_3714951 [Trichonephila clavipes]
MQFETFKFHALSKLLGTEKQHTTPYHPAANGQVERFYRQLKALYKVVDGTEKVFRILRHGKEVSMSIDRLKPAYNPKEWEDFPVAAVECCHRKMTLVVERNQQSTEGRSEERLMRSVGSSSLPLSSSDGSTPQPPQVPIFLFKKIT